jgi:hypothetical protein
MQEYWSEIEGHRKLIGEPDEKTESSESLTLIYLRKKEELAPLQSAFMGNFLMMFGSSLEYWLQDIASGDDNNLSLDLIGFEKGLLKKWCDDLPPGADCKLVLNISKAELTKQVFGAVEGPMIFYFYSEGFLETFPKDLATIERDWYRPREKLFILLGDCNCIFVGDILHVFGGVTVDSIRKFVYAPLSDFQKAKLIQRLESRATETHWQNGPRFLLPEYLKFQDRTDPKETILKPKFNKHFMDLTIASIANYTHAEGQGLVSLFEGQKRVEVKSTAAVTVSDDVCDTWFKIYEWIYKDHTHDKLAIARNLITLQPYDRGTLNYSVITSNPDLLLESAPDLYDKFIGDSIKNYFDKLKEASTYVQSKVDSLGQQVSALVDTFIKNLLATAGFIIGTVLSKLIDPNLLRVYPLLVSAFLVYMAVILFVYYPLAWWSYHLTCSEYDHSLKLYKRSFTESDLQKFVGTAFKRRKIYFWCAFGLTALVHVALLVTGYRLLRMKPF